MLQEECGFTSVLVFLPRRWMPQVQNAALIGIMGYLRFTRKKFDALGDEERLVEKDVSGIFRLVIGIQHRR